MRVKKAIIPAAGLGTRFLPATKAQPKEMLPIVDKPTIQYIVEEAVASGIEDILIITGRNKRAIEDHFDKSFELEVTLEKKGEKELLEMVRAVSDMVNIHYVRQKEAKGLGHAVYCAKSFINNEPFAVLLGDDMVYSEKPCLRQLLEKFEVCQSTILGVQPVAWDEVDKYGIITGRMNKEGMYEVKDLVEKPKIGEAPTNIAILGRYIITPTIFDILANTPVGARGEVQLTDALRELVRIEKVFAYAFEGVRYDVGNKLGFLKATVEHALRREELKEPFQEYLQNICKEWSREE
jgi:UTP--glucose-1-phosphate uridylyltransferase